MELSIVVICIVYSMEKWDKDRKDRKDRNDKKDRNDIDWMKGDNVMADFIVIAIIVLCLGLMAKSYIKKKRSGQNIGCACGGGSGDCSSCQHREAGKH